MAAPAYATGYRQSRLRLVQGGRASGLVSTFDQPPPRPGMQPIYDCETLLRHLETLKSQRSNFDTFWQDVAELVWPDAADFTFMRERQGERRTQRQFDSAAATAVEKFAAILESLMIPRAQRWHELRASDEVLNRDPEVKAWFDTTKKLLFDVRQAPRANYYGSQQVCFKSLGAFGNDCLFLEENARSAIAYRSEPVNDLWIATNHLRQVDTVYHGYKMTAKAAEQRFGKKRLTERIRKALERNPFEIFEFVRCVKPRGAEYDPERADALGMPFVAVEISVMDRQTIDEGGYHELPYIYSRYTVNPREDYGRGPAMLVHADNLTLQEMKKTMLRAGHRVAAPPILAYDDDEGTPGGARRFNMRPDAVNRGGLDERGNPRFLPFEMKGNLPLTETLLERERFTIDDAFLGAVKLMQALLEHPTMTATQVLTLMQKEGQLIAPMIGRQQSEKLGPQIEREIGLLARAGMLPPLPPALVEARGQYEIEYVSPATRMQRTEELIAFQRTVEITAPLAQIDPSVWENFDADEIVRGTADITGVPGKWLRAPEAVAKIREVQREAAEQARLLEAAPVVAGAAKDAAGAMREAGAQ